ncbi:hypothetical protein CEXT_738321 [Caerostris extrusa]|uniref:Uncharacterized protein n=1 Tax=Caerostris extrusa TaxID=172846 RepID=A0AAV4VQ30_CAEEX|nr:hypothetical protein CEXT_738321 [Caerostris extrusa]
MSATITVPLDMMMIVRDRQKIACSFLSFDSTPFETISIQSPSIRRTTVPKKGPIVLLPLWDKVATAQRTCPLHRCPDYVCKSLDSEVHELSSQDQYDRRSDVTIAGSIVAKLK